MDDKKQLPQQKEEKSSKQKGQSIVLIAFALVALIGFIGIAVDVGFIFARGSQLQAAIDAAALAAVTELSGGTIVEADTKAGQFLNANNIPISVTLNMQSTTSETPLGATEYSLTVTWPVELFFLKVLRVEVGNVSVPIPDTIDLTRSATAAYFPLADIYASRRVEVGALSTSNQGVFGPNICTNYGDPFSPTSSSPPDGGGFYTYNYRILIPPDYDDDTLRVELFDPDSINRPDNDADVTFTNTAHAVDPDNFPLAPQEMSCVGGNRNQKQPCLIRTGEEDLVDPNGDPPIEIDQLNPFWFMRIDENRGTGTAPGNGNCGQPGSYDPRYNTATLYELFYWVQNPDGTPRRINLARYTGQTGDTCTGPNTPVGCGSDHNTDMRWVSPGGSLTTDPPAELGSFELDIDNDLVGILSEPGSNTRYVYLDVTTIRGASENGFEIWAGPLYPDVSVDVNVRNIQVTNNPGVHSSRGATVFGIGNLPMNSNFDYAVDIPLIYIGPELAGKEVHVSLFDTDSGADPPITFFFDTIDQADWSVSFGDGDPDPDGVSGRCLPGGCNNQWVSPPYEITVPGNLDNCDWDNPTMEDCTPFYGGRLMANYIGGMHDTYGWQIRVTGLPYLVK